jgi:two-component system nitrate/nitrite response regulator NarL
MHTIKVVLLDDKEIIREGLARLLEEHDTIEVVFKCSKVQEVLAEVKRTKPDIVLINDNLAERESSEAVRMISESDPQIKVAVLTDSISQKDLLAAIESGATGYLHKETKVDDFIESIDLIGRGGVVISPPVAERLGDKLDLKSDSKEEERTELSGREVEIVSLLAKGATNKDIARDLYIAENTVKVHIKNILQKLQLRNRQQIAAYAVKEELVTDLGKQDNEEE